MTQNLNASAVILAVRVGPAAGEAGPARRLPGLHDQQVRYVRDLLITAGGQGVESPGTDAVLRFEGWPEAIDAALALTSDISRLTTHNAGMEIGVGLDLADARIDADDIQHAAALASSAPSNEIHLGDALATIARNDPPDRWVVKPVSGDVTPDEAIAHRLASARDEVPNNLPVPLTSFVGREAELREVRGLLAQARLVTVTGPPGAGKTRFANELAERLLGRFEEGAWFVGLAPIADSRLMLSSLAGALGLQPQADGALIDAIRLHLQARRVLVVLDNFEHIMDAAPELTTLLAAIPTLRVLVTSRTPLHVSGEHEYPLAPLDLPPLSGSADDVSRSEAGDLFARRAMASQSTFRIDDENASQVGELCHRLDGLPLAIELAAARVKILPLPGILARLDHRLTLLTGGPRDAPARHQSLRAAVAWSYDLLEPAPQQLFQRLSVFRGGWTIDGAATVHGSVSSDTDLVFGALGSLLDGSLIARQASGATLSRFTMLETLREFAAERLSEAGETDEAQGRHAAHYLALVEGCEPGFTGQNPVAALDTIAVEHDNIRAALDHLLRARPDDALRMAAGLWRFWQMRGHLVEGSAWLSRAFEAAGGGGDDDALRAKALTALGGLAYWRGDMAEAREHYDAALLAWRRIGDPVGVAGALYDLGFVFYAGFYPRPEDPARTAAGLTILEEAETLYRQAGEEAGIARTGWAIGAFVIYSDPVRARPLLGASVERFRRLNDRFGLGWALRTYCQALLGTGDLGGAAGAASEALQLFAAARDGSAMGLLLDDFADIAQAEGDVLRAARLRGAAAGLRHVSEAEIANEHVWETGVDESTTDSTNPAALQQAWTEGQAMSQAEATAYALASEPTSAADEKLRVTTLGAFLVERSGAPVAHWGGPKAGSRQAQALFAFLLDRGERGATKDEFIDVIWPDAEVSQADLNFHRTLGGLRGTLEPERATVGTAITFMNGRYRLNASVVGWLDSDEFEERLVNAARATDDVAAIRGLESARAMYRGDYLDDCPLFGDSGYVEGRRGVLRGRLIDALVDLGRRYEARGESTLAAARFREALAVSEGECDAAEDGLKRLGVSVAS